MGIPFYFKSLLTKYAHIVRPFDRHGNNKIGRLYLDFNSIVHNSAHRVNQRGHFNDLKSMYSAIIKDVLDYTTQLISLVDPKKLVYIALDGPCPRAKLQQQRKRRFISAWRNDMLNNHSGRNNQVVRPYVLKWDSNTVTPGTEFMAMLDEALIAYAKNRPLIVVSPSTEYGEGEHKIMQHLKSNPVSCDLIDLIYGLDADLILLSLLKTHSHKLTLLRESTQFGPQNNTQTHSHTHSHSHSKYIQFLTLDVNALRQALIHEYLGSNVQCSITQTKFLNDYVLLCTLVGNDFLPPLSYFKIKNNGIDIILQGYITHVFKLSQFLVQYDKVGQPEALNLQIIASLMSQFAKTEDAYMHEAATHYYQNNVHLDPKRGLEMYLDNYPAINKPYFRIATKNCKGWRTDWYHHLFHGYSSEVVNRACQKYYEGLNWVFQYYFLDNASWAWYYPFCYSPTVLDLSHFLSNALHIPVSLDECSKLSSTHKEFMNNFNTDVHLLIVLPPQSCNLVKPCLQSLFSCYRSGVAHLYPVKFNLTCFLKTYLWESSAQLPDIDFKSVVCSYTRAINQN